MTSYHIPWPHLVQSLGYQHVILLPVTSNNDVTASTVPVVVFFLPNCHFSFHLRPQLCHTDQKAYSSLHSNPRPIYMNSVTADALLALYVLGA